MSEERPAARRGVASDRERTPPHRIPDEPTATHAVEVLRLSVPLPDRGRERLRLPDRQRLRLRLPDRQRLRLRLPDRQRLRLRLRLSVRLPRHGPRLAAPVRYALRARNRSVGKGLLAAWKEPGAAVPPRPRRSYHPSLEGSPRRAFTCPARSRAVRAGAIGRAAVR
ncbi:hypothetical protein [Streptomyces sp. NPDC048489]|uniref:hypothetical protein n=1 Tax=Streptomyces sp. NPDC048489 TaxID=3154504 RepID=UPI0034495946